MPEPEELTEQALLSLLGQSRNPLTLREIASILGLRHAGRRALAKMVTRLKRRGRLTEFGGGRFQLSDRDRPAKEPRNQAKKHPRGQQAPQQTGASSISTCMENKSAPLRSDPNFLVGRLVAHRDGYGFVVPETPRPDIDGDLFIPPDQAGDAMHGDRVMARIERRDQRRGFAGRNFPTKGPSEGPRRAEGRIVKVLDRVHATVVGLFKRGPRGNVVMPFESRILQEIIIPPGDEVVRGRAGRHAVPAATDHRVSAPVVDTFDGAVVDVEITRFPRGGVAAAGRVIEVLGRPDEFGVDVEIMIRKHHLPHRFAEDVINEAETAAKPVTAAETDGRRDFRDLPIVTIDGETARDFDDAVYVERRPHGWYLQVHIADVAHYVQRNSALDREARLRGTSVYFPDRAVPMLPEELSNGICSLNPCEDRLVQSALLEFDHDGTVTGAEFTSGVIRSVERMTYTDVNRVIQGDAEATQRYAALAERFRGMRDLALILNARRTRRGSMDFDLPEPLLTFDDEGRITGIVRSERNIAHRLIEEFMLAANQAVAKYLEDRGFTSLHRVHEKPDLKKVLEFEELARAFGYSLGVPGLTERRVAVKHGGAPPAGQTARPQRAQIRRRAATTRDGLRPRRGGFPHQAAALPAPHPKNRRQARGAHSLLPDVAFSQAGALHHTAAGPLRLGLRPVRAFHVAHSPLSGPDRSPHSEVGHGSPRRLAGRDTSQIATPNSRLSRSKLRNRNAAPKAPSAN